MNKLNRKFNRAFERLTFWDALSRHFLGFNSLLIARDCLTTDDRKTLLKIHSLLFECCKEANSRRNAHQQAISNLRKELSNGGYTTNNH